MSLRALPNLTQPESRDISFQLNDRAVKAWSPGLAPTALAEADGEAVIRILEEVGYDWWTGGGVTAQGVADQLKALGAQPVTVLINSPGGNFFEGVAIYNLLRQHPAKVTVQIIGVAASAASVIALAGDWIEIARTGFVMTHNTQWCCCGDRHAMRATAAAMEVFDETLNAAYAERTGQTVETIAAWNDAEHWAAGSTAVDEGFADALMAGEVKAVDDPQNARPALYRVEAALQRQGVPRAERRALMKEICGTPRAAAEAAMPGAGDPGAEDGSDHLKLALATLKLASV